VKHSHIAFILSLLFMFVSPAIFAQSADVQARGQAAAKAVPDNFSFIYAPSSGAIADETFVLTSKAKGPSAMAKTLGKLFRNADSQPLVIAVSGPSNTKTVQVIKDALVVTKKSELSKLKLVFVGGESAAKEVEAAINTVGGTFVFAKF